MKEVQHGRLVKLRAKTVRAFPVTVRLPEWFLKRNDIKMGDKLYVYMSDAGDLIISKH